MVQGIIPSLEYSWIPTSISLYLELEKQANQQTDITDGIRTFPRLQKRVYSKSILEEYTFEYALIRHVFSGKSQKLLGGIFREIFPRRDFPGKKISKNSKILNLQIFSQFLKIHIFLTRLAEIWKIFIFLEIVISWLEKWVQAGRNMGPAAREVDPFCEPASRMGPAASKTGRSARWAPQPKRGHWRAPGRAR